MNEHPERTAITQQLLKETDVVIFLANASRPLTQGERDLMQDLKVQLNGGKADEPAENLFVAVNFMDLLRREKDRQDVQQRIGRFVQGQNIITGKNRIHFISAQAALDAILDGTEDEYVKAFRSFTQSIEKFLTVERGPLEIKQAFTKINGLIQEGLDGLHHAEAVLDGKVNLSTAAKQEMLEQIGEASGCDVRIQNLADELMDEVIEQAAISWDNWREELGERIVERSIHWHSEHSHIWNQKELIGDYANLFIRDLQREIDEWSNTQLQELILKPEIELLNKNVNQELEKINRNFKQLNLKTNANLSQHFNFRIKGIDGDIGGAGGFMGGIGAGGALAAGLLAFTGIGLIPVVIAAVATTIAGSFGLGLLDIDGIHDQIKLKVLEQGFEKFNDSTEKIWERLGEIIGAAFNSRLEVADKAIAEVISCYENVLEQQERVHQETQEQCEAEKAWIAQKRQELEQLQKNIKAIIPS